MFVAYTRAGPSRRERQSWIRVYFLAQGLIGVITQLEAAMQATVDPAAKQRHLDNATGLARDSLSEARRSVHALRPAALENGQLPAALGEAANRWSALSKLPVELGVKDRAAAVAAAFERGLLTPGGHA
ncbi:MAG: histidine kinase [Acidimicrobiales bacterium]